jgi:peptidoglycan/xylan/chitin deacetylase (PgdA/CDA1 family)
MINGFRRLRQTARRLKNRFISTALILVYHRVTEVPSDPQLLCVAPEHFADQLEVLRQYYQPIQLHQMAKDLQNGVLPHHSIAVTFDDGYADNLYWGKPLLEQYDVPATIFVTTGHIGEQREFWWDELERLFLQPGSLPERLDLDVNGRMHQWELGQAAHYSQEAHKQYRGWNVLEEDDPSPRHHLYRSLCALLRPLTDKERWGILDELIVWTGKDLMGRQTHRALSPDEVLQLDAGDLIEVGSHTVRHPILSKLPIATQRDEIEGSKQHLEDIVGHPVVTFAYPYGSRFDYTSDTVAIVQKVGFICACSNFIDVVWKGSDRFQLPRVLVRDWGAEEFAERLHGYFNGSI